MTQHKWHKEIKAWADGAEIQNKLLEKYGNDEWEDDYNPNFMDDTVEFRIKPQPKEPQYLYVYKSENNRKILFSTGIESNVLLEYVGKIKLEVDV